MSAVPEGLLEIGHLRKAHGVRGQLNVELTSDREERVLPGAKWFARGEWLTVRDASPHLDRWIVTFDEIGDRSAAQRYTNTVVYAEALADDGALWVHELIGADVVEIDGTARGRCVSVVENPAADLLELESGALVPVVFVVEHDGRRVVIDPPPGLFELAATSSDQAGANGTG
jgi:16S rRNA processing protein RimM